MSRILAGRSRWRIGRSRDAGAAPGWRSGTTGRGWASPWLMGVLLGAWGPEALLQKATPDLDQPGLLGGSQLRPKGWGIGGRIESDDGLGRWGGTRRRMGALRDRVADGAGTNRPGPARPTGSR